jgi:hypothetical protein
MTSSNRNREEAIITQLEVFHSHCKQRPDVIFQLHGLRVLMEGKFNDVPNAPISNLM